MQATLPSFLAALALSAATTAQSFNVDISTNSGFGSANGIQLVAQAAPPPNTCPWDCQAAPQSGAVDVPDLLALLGAWGGPQTPGTTCDLDGSGAIAVPDLLQLLGNWGPCP